ncbi:MAG: DUF6438 domain-containing protein [Bryobacteraceae bacterium]
MKSILFALALASALPSFGQSHEAAPDTLIVLQRGACEQRCAVYRLVVFADGNVIYQGQYFVRRQGLLRSLISQDKLQKLIADLENGGFFQLKDNYGYGSAANCASLDAGEPSAILSVSSRGRSKTILHNHGCAGADSDKLTGLEDKVDAAVGAGKWIK